MPYADTTGYTSRSVAQKQFGRSKSSFIRDIDEAFTQDDQEFLSNFCVFLNDETILVGKEATKEVVDGNRKLSPRWFIKTSFLETRYWEKNTECKEEGSEADSHQPADLNTKDNLDSDLRHQLEIVNEKLNSKNHTIERLEADKQFLQEELSHRRGEIDRLRELISSVGDSAAKLKTGESVPPQSNNDSSVTVEAEVVEANPSKAKRSSSAKKRKNMTAAQKHIPTFHRVYQYFRRGDD